MFPPFPGFEEFELRVEVEWRNETRFVVARLETLPGLPRTAVVVVAFEDAPAEGEWLVLYSDGCGPLPFTNPNNIPKLRRIVANAFGGRALQLARVFEFAQLPVSPRWTWLVAPLGGYWLGDWKDAGWHGRREKITPFAFDAPWDTSQDEARERLWRVWNDSSSDARFAWSWAQKNRDQKMAQLCGFDGNWSELERVMRLVLLDTASLWQRGHAWRWSLHHEFAGRGWLFNQFNRSDTTQNLRLTVWQEFLYDHFVPDLRAELMEHVCAREFWQHAGELQNVQLSEAPTMHERIEARLQLREWLQDKAAPNEMEKLLAL